MDLKGDNNAYAEKIPGSVLVLSKTLIVKVLTNKLLVAGKALYCVSPQDALLCLFITKCI